MFLLERKISLLQFNLINRFHEKIEAEAAATTL
jgi:hypothetical protein